MEEFQTFASKVEAEEIVRKLTRNHIPYQIEAVDEDGERADSKQPSCIKLLLHEEDLKKAAGFLDA